MPQANRNLRGTRVQAKRFRMVVPILTLTLGLGGCLVTASRYEEKTKEADSLRDAMASVNREKKALESEYAAMQKQLADEKKANEALSSRVREEEEGLDRARTELASIARDYKEREITREEMISLLLEKEKATGKRIQELSAMAQACDVERDKLRRETVLQASAIAELENRVTETPEMESLRRERDILLGRIERIQEDHLRESRRREIRFAELAKTFSGISSQIATVPVGPAMRVLVPDQILFLDGKTTLTDTGKQVIGEVGKTVSEFPAAAIIITAGGMPKIDEIRSLLTKTHSLPQGKILASAGSGGRETELLLVIP
jgi:flagellar motor protein MotB